MARSHLLVCRSAPPGVLHLRWQILVSQLCENRQGFCMQAFHQFHDTFVIGGEFVAVAGIAARAILNVLGEHVAFGDREVAQEIAKRETARRVSPIDLVWGNATGDTHGALTDVIKIF
jgi:hypothetical protein